MGQLVILNFLLCHGTVCVVGKMRDLILQLSKVRFIQQSPVFAMFLPKLTVHAFIFFHLLCLPVITKRYAGSFVTRDFGG